MSEDFEGLSDEELAEAMEEADAQAYALTEQRAELLEEARANQERQDALKAEYLRRNPPEPTGSIG